jgi:molecular chaperone GrpE (heat shock protein)
MEAQQENDEEAEKCTQLAKQIKALKGKPQRRHAALERYRLMCTDKAQTE